MKVIFIVVVVLKKFSSLLREDRFITFSLTLTLSHREREFSSPTSGPLKLEREGSRSSFPLWGDCLKRTGNNLHSKNPLPKGEGAEPLGEAGEGEFLPPVGEG